MPITAPITSIRFATGIKPSPSPTSHHCHRQRIEFLIRGLRWAVQRFEESLPRLNPAARDVLARMRDSHLRSIAACEKVVQLLPK